MTLFSIGIKNMKRKFRNYFLYFASMIFSIVIYFSFSSLKYDQTIQATSQTSQKINSVFSGASFVLMIFVAIFIWYSNSFFTRQRKKEIALYSLLGVRKRMIGLLLFYENFIMGVLALVIGILFGALLSDLFVSLLMSLMGYQPITNFSISTDAVVNTVIVFMVITLITSFHGYRLIYQSELIDLFRAENEGEKNPKASISIALFSVFSISLSYWLALQNILTSKVWSTIGILWTPVLILLTVVLGTYFLFNTSIVYVLKVLGTNKKYDWKGTNMIGRSQLLYRIKGNARTLTAIAVLSATTLTAVSTAFSLYYSNVTNVKNINPNSMMFINVDDTITEKTNDIIVNNKKHNVLEHKSIEALEVKADVSKLNDMFSAEHQMYTLISNDTFIRLASSQDRNTSLSLKGMEVVLLDPGYMANLSPDYTEKTIPINVNKGEEQVTFKEVRTYSVLNAATANKTLVVSKELFEHLQKDMKPIKLELYTITDEKTAEQLTKDVQAALPDEAKFSSFFQDYASTMESSGLIIFMAGFLGLVFLAATGSIIYFKQMTEAHADKGNYVILNKIGVTRKEMKKTIAEQVGFIFVLPLIMGILHCVVALASLSNLIQANLFLPVIICIGSYTVIYFIYYVITVKAYNKIVTKSFIQ
ncbi:ABC transporter permease [Bacillus sp. es.036]|uniref:ABC transporter permease n=1 Tax=Bacillus sp. es.036 TaxID=1761764 RepID=UPI000BF75612|nr:ABC transporter permease [Bacillus sp. es.036]PFG14495.1 putative ABC transport system permease protein [Bacillus sp. es.036]